MLLNRLWLPFFLAIFVCVSFLDSADALSTFEQRMSLEHQELEANGYTRWQWLRSDCLDCDIILLPIRPEVQTEKVQLFTQALSAHKAGLQQLYQISGAEYNFLAHMSVGILGRESLFFKSQRYKLKEMLPWAVHLGKIIESYLLGNQGKVSNNSRGPTQIKVVPEKVARHYGIRNDNLYLPENAAIATVAYLIEALRELKQRVVMNDLNFINAGNYVDYLPYIYFGGTKFLIQKNATPESNQYVRDMKRYMSWFELYERKPMVIVP